MGDRLEEEALDRIWPALLACREGLGERRLVESPPGGLRRALLFVRGPDRRWTFSQPAGSDPRPPGRRPPLLPGAGSGPGREPSLVLLWGDGSAEIGTATGGEAPHDAITPFTDAARRRGSSPWPDPLATAVPLAPAEQAVFRCYLPFLAGLARARAMDHAVVSGHLTTTLDGRIAPPAGPGLWLGNGADRRHTHRLRALHDAVLVGRRTLERDDPLLTVREVTGPTPRRVVLDPSLALLRRDGGYRAFAAPGAILLHAAGCPCPASPPPGVTLLPVAAAPAVGGEGGEGSVLPPDGILAALAGVGIHSVFVEGGGQTLMRFLAAGRMDLLHLHLAPRLLGAGVPAVALPEGAGVPDLRYLLTPFLLDGEVLLECQPALPP